MRNINAAHKPMKSVLVAGLGKTGLSCTRFLAQRGIPFVVADSREQPPGLNQLRKERPQVEVHLGEFDPNLFMCSSQVILSPGIPLDVTAVKVARDAGVPVIGDIELFARHVNAPVVAITGSNGKSTTVTLLGEMAVRAGREVRVGGNLGTPALDLLDAVRTDLYVLELSSFQLEVTDSLKCFASTVLNISEDHMDRHHNLPEYAAVKQRIFRGRGTMVLNGDDPLVAAMAESERNTTCFTLSTPRGAQDFGVAMRSGAEWIVRGDEPIMRVSELRMAGRHNLANALAALALGEAAGLPRGAMTATLCEFPGLPHRCQFVAEIGGVGYYNDSKGTNVGSTVAALAGMPGDKVVLIAGGEGKDQDFTPLCGAVASRARAAVLIGRDAEIIAAAIGDAVPVMHATSMAEAVAKAGKAAKPGDSVLLSPACASFDMFKNYEHRGKVFSAVVKEAAP